MDRASYDATAGLRLALASLVAGAFALLSPVLLLGTVDAPTSVSLAMVALVLAALVRLGEHGTAVTGRLAAVRPPTRDETPPVPTGRITDPTHHPLRPRAPGPA